MPCFKMTSAYLESDSDSEPAQVSDSSDVDLPECVIRSPNKLPKSSDVGSFSEARSPQDIKPTPSQLQASLLSSPIHKAKPFSDTSYISPTNPPPIPTSVSPSPNKLKDRHEKSLKEQQKLTSRVERLTAKIKTRNEKTSKLEEYRSMGGIRGLSNHLNEQVRSTSSEGDVEDGSVSEAPSRQQQAYNPSNTFPYPLYAPGYPVFTHAPNLITELYPPGYHEVEEGSSFQNLEMHMMKQQSPEVLHQLICDRWLLLCYHLKPCPAHIWEWLFQVTCLSCDQVLAERAYMNLESLVERASDKSRVYVPSLSTVLDVLVSLGADRELLQEDTAPLTPTAEPADDVFPPSPPSHLSNLTYLIRYLTLAVTSHPSLLTPTHLSHLLHTLVTVSLDSTLTGQPRLQGMISRCLSSLVSAIPDSSWGEVLHPLARRLVKQGLQHHHNLLHICRLLLPSCPAMIQLQKVVLRYSVWELVFPGTPHQPLSDWAFGWTVVGHYYDMPASDYQYYPMYSVVCLLSQLLNQFPPEWPQLEKKREFKSMLSKIASVKIRDSAERTERAPVKDMLISLSLEMANQRSRNTVQTDLFSMMGH